MKTFIIPLFLLAIACGNTKKTTLPVVSEVNNPSTPIKKIENIPPCLADQLSKIQANQYENPPVQVDEYEYNGRTVYLFTSECCDQYNVLFDDNCKGFCAPSGGVTGRGDGKCGDFKTNGKLVRNIWKKTP